MLLKNKIKSLVGIKWVLALDTMIGFQGEDYVEFEIMWKFFLNPIRRLKPIFIPKSAPS